MSTRFCPGISLLPSRNIANLTFVLNLNSLNSRIARLELEATLNFEFGMYRALDIFIIDLLSKYGGECTTVVPQWQTQCYRRVKRMRAVNI